MSSNSISPKTHFCTRTRPQNQNICADGPDHLLLWPMSETWTKVFFGYSNHNVQTRNPLGGSTLVVYLHICSQGCPGRRYAPLIQPGFGSLPCNTALLSQAGHKATGQGSFVCSQSHSGHTFLRINPEFLQRASVVPQNSQQQLRNRS